MHISRCCAITRILLLPPADAPTGAVAAARAAAAEGDTEQPRPLRLDMSVRQLQLCLWDDERQRLLPPAGDGEGGGSSLLGEELFCLSVDALHIHLSRQPLLDAAAAAAAAASLGAAAAQQQRRPLHPWQRQPLVASTAWLAAGGGQLDSFLPSSEQPVLLTSLPEDSLEGMGGSGGSTSTSRRPGPPLQLGLVVHHCPPLPGGGGGSAAEPADSSSGGSGMSFRNAWVHDLLVQLPTLAVAADDALLLFADRASTLLLGGGAGGEEDSSSGGDGPGPASSGGQDASAAGAQPAAAQQVAGAVGEAQPLPLAALQQSLAAEAAGAAASRLYIEQAAVESGEWWDVHGSARVTLHVALLHGTGRGQCMLSRPLPPMRPLHTQHPAELPGGTVPTAPQCGCCWMLTSQRAQRACLWQSTPTAPPSPSPASPPTTCCSGAPGLG